MTKLKSEILLEELNRKSEEIDAKKVELNKLRDEFLEIKKKIIRATVDRLRIDWGYLVSRQKHIQQQI